MVQELQIVFSCISEKRSLTVLLSAIKTRKARELYQTLVECFYCQIQAQDDEDGNNTFISMG